MDLSDIFLKSAKRIWEINEFCISTPTPEYLKFQRGSQSQSNMG